MKSAVSSMKEIARLLEDGHRALKKNDFDRALQALTHAFKIRCEAFSRLATVIGVDSKLPFPLVSIARLENEIERVDYLCRLGRAIPSARESLLKARVLLRELAKENGTFFLTDERGELLSGLERAGKTSVPPGALSTGAVGSRDTSGVLDSVRREGFAVIDDYLEPPALGSLRNFCLEADIWHDMKPWAAGSRMHEGFCCGLLFQIVKETSEVFSEILSGISFSRMWAYRYENSAIELIPHADLGEVSINLWITPDEANLNPESGGLLFYEESSPLSWNEDDYLASAEQRGKNLPTSSRRKIPYRANRAVIFDSRRFHGADRIEFGDAYENRRISVTLVFG